MENDQRKPSLWETESWDVRRRKPFKKVDKNPGNTH